MFFLGRGGAEYSTVSLQLQFEENWSIEQNVLLLVCKGIFD